MKSPRVLLLVLLTAVHLAVAAPSASAQEAPLAPLDLEFTYQGDAPPEARAAMLQVEEILAAVLVSPIPLRMVIAWEPGEEGTLASAAATSFVSGFSNAPRTDVDYPITLASVLAGEDLVPGQFHIESDVNANFDWDYSLGTTDPAKVDFIGTMVHEVLHGLGFAGYFGCETDGTACTYRDPSTGNPAIFDTFIVLGADQAITSIPEESAALSAAMTSDNLFWNGPLAIAAATSAESGGDICGDGDDACPTRPKIHAPDPYQPGSSGAHWDEDTYPASSPNSLMTASGADGETSQVVGPMTRAVLREIGWPAPAVAYDIVRLAGNDRERTAVAVSQQQFLDANAADTVVLARADDPSGFADALSGAPLAAANGGPLLLTNPTTLNGAVLDEIQRVLAPGGTVVVLGGSGAISDGVTDALTDAGIANRRIAGANRFATAAAIADELETIAPVETVFLATGLDFPDALAASAAAVHVDGAVLLVAGDTPAEATEAWLAANAPTTSFAVGGPAAQAHPDATAVVGANRIATSVALAAAVFEDPTVVGLARFDRFPDALAGAAHIGSLGGPMILTAPNVLLDATTAGLCAVRSTTERAFLYGGLGAIDADVESAIGNVLATGAGC